MSVDFLDNACNFYRREPFNFALFHHKILVNLLRALHKQLSAYAQELPPDLILLPSGIFCIGPLAIAMRQHARPAAQHVMGAARVDWDSSQFRAGVVKTRLAYT